MAEKHPVCQIRIVPYIKGADGSVAITTEFLDQLNKMDTTPPPVAVADIETAMVSADDSKFILQFKSGKTYEVIRSTDDKGNLYSVFKLAHSAPVNPSMPQVGASKSAIEDMCKVDGGKGSKKGGKKGRKSDPIAEGKLHGLTESERKLTDKIEEQLIEKKASKEEIHQAKLDFIKDFRAEKKSEVALAVKDINKEILREELKKLFPKKKTSPRRSRRSKNKDAEEKKK